MISNCRSCFSPDLKTIINLGNQYLSDFRNDKSKPDSFPLNLLLCNTCNLVQLDATVSRDLMYHDGYGYKSGINDLIVKNLKMLVAYGMKLKENPSRWLDIACNDGTLLSMLPSNIFRVGVDPVKKFKELSKMHADLIINDFFPCDATKDLDKFDVITSISMFYDIDDPNQFVKDVKDKLSADGIWIVQQNYLLAMLQNNSFDNICHEHIEYYSLKAMNYLMEKNGLEIFDVFLDEINGGSLITAMTHKGKRVVKPSVELQLQKELDYGLETMKPYKEFESRVEQIKIELIDLLKKIKSRNQRVQIYGASTRGATIWQYIHADENLVECAVERQNEKIGKFFSAVGLPIISEEQMRINPPDYLLVGPWFLKESFVKREQDFLAEGGKFIFPLPIVEIVSDL
jgi:NDP-4-keto-2,6-dideoxyhexose 3-C-methyltransferase